MSIKQHDKLTADYDSPAQKIPLDSLDSLDSLDIDSEWVTFLFQGDNSDDIELVAKGQDSGYEIRSGDRYVSGPHRWQNTDSSIYLYGSSSGTVTVKVIETLGSRSFRHGPVSEEIDIDTSNTVLDTLQNFSSSGSIQRERSSTTTNLTQLNSGNEATLALIKAEYQASDFAGGEDLYLQLWDGDPNSGGTLVEQSPFSIPSTPVSDSEFLDRADLNGVTVSDPYIGVSTAFGSWTAASSVYYLMGYYS